MNRAVLRGAARWHRWLRAHGAPDRRQLAAVAGPSPGARAGRLRRLGGLIGAIGACGSAAALALTPSDAELVARKVAPRSNAYRHSVQHAAAAACGGGDDGPGATLVFAMDCSSESAARWAQSAAKRTRACSH